MTSAGPRWIRPRSGLAQPAQHRLELGLAVALDPRDRHDLRCSHFQADIEEVPGVLAGGAGVRCRGEIVQRQHGRPGGCRAGLGRSIPGLSNFAEHRHFAAHHQPGQLQRAGRLRRHRRNVGPGPQDGYPVGCGHHLVEMVGDHHDGRAGGGHSLQLLDQVVYLDRRECGRRLVEDQDPRAAVQRSQDLHPLLLAYREVPDERGRRHRKPVALAQVLDVGGYLCQVGKPDAATLAGAQDHVLGH